MNPAYLEIDIVPLNKRWNILLLLVLAAAVFYSIGFYSGAVAAIAVGGMFELAFWVKLFRNGGKKP